ncbi:Mediator of RNA polymerase II transcription subunit 22 [Lamellibrachia satsuma]|nr:Mediator of RNA polymerase II transcription subunit 22 [Lamellibrachia satsuma]
MSLPQSKEALLKSYQKWLKDDIKSMVDNYTEIMKLAKIEGESQMSRPMQAEQDQYEMEVRSANIVRAGESLMKLVSHIKQFLILNDFPSVNDSIAQTVHRLNNIQKDCDTKLMVLRDEMSAHLFELEEEYYSSVYK